MKRDWAAIETDSQTPCRICGIIGRTERAHVAGRKYDRPKSAGSKTRRVDPESIVPLCGPSGDRHSCHHQFDAGEIDLLPHLTLAEQIRAVEDLGGIESARIKLAPSDYHRETNRARERVWEAKDS